MDSELRVSVLRLIEHLVCSGRTNAWAVPTATASATKIDETLLHKGHWSMRRWKRRAEADNSISELTDSRQRMTQSCWMRGDTSPSVALRAILGLRKT